MNARQESHGPHRAAPATAQRNTPRRSFLRTVWIVLGGAALVEAGVVAGSFLRPRPRARDSSRRQIVIAGPVERFDPGSVTAFPEGKFYLVRLEDGGFLALSRTCTHLGCTVPWDRTRQRFTCPCHASEFDMRGEVAGAPALRPLDVYPVRIENRIVKVETRTPVRRHRFDPSQVTRS